MLGAQNASFASIIGKDLLVPRCQGLKSSIKIKEELSLGEAHIWGIVLLDHPFMS